MNFTRRGWLSWLGTCLGVAAARVLDDGQSSQMPNGVPTRLSSDRTEHAQAGHQYALDVTAGRILSCKWVKASCQRHLDDLVRSERDPEWPYVFDPVKAGRVARFIEQLPHVKGEWAARKERIKLEPWQCFVYATAFGWVRREDRSVRRFRIVYVEIPRKSAKSTLAAGTGLYMLAADGEAGAEVYAGATCKRQAGEVFRPAKLMVERTPRLREAFGIRPGAHRLTVLPTSSFFEALVRSPGDGASPSCAIVDEYHEHPTDVLVDAMRTGMGARKQPLLWIITTAGANIGGPCYLMHADVQKVLEGTLVQDETFGIIYTIDDEADWTSEEALRMANPNYGVSVGAEFLRTEQAAAIASSRKQNIFKTKHLNIWCGAAEGWMNMELWRDRADYGLKIEQFLKEPAWIGVDLSSTTDFTANVRVFRRMDIKAGKAHYYCFCRFYLPEARIAESQSYQQWCHDGWITSIPGPTVDLAVMRGDLVDDAKRYNVREIAFDPYMALETQQELARELGPSKVVTIPQQVRYLSDPMKQLEALVLEKRFHHDGNPVLNWMMSNVVVREDANENIFPRKEKPENKIDGAVALILALARALANPNGGTSIYSTRGLLST